MDNTQGFIAHLYPNKDGDWQFHQVRDHLQKVAELASRFAGERGAVFAHYAGLLHDLGKYQQAFQDYIANASGFDEKENAHIEDLEAVKPKKIPHSTAGAKYLVKKDNEFNPFFGHLLAYLIAGHHAGLADWHDKGDLCHRLQQADAELEKALAGAKQDGFEQHLKNLNNQALLDGFPSFFNSADKVYAEVHIWMRFLFSCLVDADFLDTEAFMNGYPDADAAKQAGIRPSSPDLAELHQRYQDYMAAKISAAQQHNSELNRERQNILEQCFQAAELDKSLFGLTVPTGGGKTLASLGFALKHALKFGKKRIIYAIPFTSIIEQNADVFRQALGDQVVLEHHSNLEADEKKENGRNRLAAENWDAPLIVTTNVQFFESLFAARTSRCRKIHNIADSVVILDEAQQIPREFQKPITDTMRVLARDYGVTFVLCTATPPELGKDVDVFGKVMLEGLGEVHEIIQDKIALAKRLRRVEIKLPEKNAAKQSWQQIADEIAQRDCVLAVVNTRRHARKLFAALPDTGIKVHLSANMCAAHRAEVIALIRRYLHHYQTGQLTQHVWVVSTQLIEAGVDLDFPVVYRAMAGLDSIAQAAGRCNREGKLNFGEVVVFRADEGAPAGSLRQGQDITEEMLAAGLLNDPLSPDTFAEYFRRFNAKGERDKHGISKLLTAECSNSHPLAIKFRSAAEKFRLIDNKGVALIVPFIPLVQQQEDGVKMVKTRELADFLNQHLNTVALEAWQEQLAQLRYPSPPDKSFGQTDKPPLPELFETWFSYLESKTLAHKYKWVYRKLQRYTVTVSEYEMKKLPQGAVFERAGLLVLDSGYYDAVLGLAAVDDAWSLEQPVY